MQHPEARQHRSILQEIARQAMTERGLAPEFSPAALTELAAIQEPAQAGSSFRDLTPLPWCSIDNDDSRDLDQLTVAVVAPGEPVKVLVAIAGVADLVPRGSALDAHASGNTTSVYTAGGIFPMLPEKLSTDLTSLGFRANRAAYIIEMAFDGEGVLKASDIYRATVRNQAKLAYNSVAAWLDGTGPRPLAISAVPGLDENIRLQHRIADQLRGLRHMRGALSLETLEARPVFDGEMLRDLVPDQSNSAKSLIEELMVASNGVTARYLAAHAFPSMRRVVRTPSKWPQIIQLAATKGGSLPPRPDGKALEQFLLEQKKADPDYFPDLSLCVVKLLGRGEYVVEFPGGTVAGHFGLAVADYAHSTAPNRRFPDLVVQRLLAAALAANKTPYANEELSAIAQHCTEQEVAAKKVERQVVKSAGAMLLSRRIGETFDATVTGASEKGTWIRLLNPPVEGKLVKGFEHRKVGDRLRARLTFTDVERGYVDFAAA